jgi:hypothetical protein
MKKLSILICTMIALAGFMATTVRAQSPHFIKGPTLAYDASTGNLCASFKEAGLGNAPITYTLTAAGATFTFQCFTKSNNTPQGDPNSTSISNASTSTTITPHNGQITGTLCLEPCQGGSCQGGGLVLKLIGASYTGPVTFCDATDNVCITSQDSFGGSVTPAVKASTLSPCP